MASKLPEMARGKSQVLYNYLPGKTFDIIGGISIAKVSSIIGETDNGSDEMNNKDKLFATIKNYIERWDENHRPDFRHFDYMVNNRRFAIERPRGVKYDIFPLIFKCGKCNTVFPYKNYKDIEKHNPNLICNRCKDSKLRQIYHVAVHDCGNIHGLYPLKPCECGDQYLVFDDRRSQKSADFRWVCTKCGKEREVQYFCSECDSQDKKMTIAPHRATKCYYAHNVKCVDIQGSRDNDDLLSVVGKYFGTKESSADTQIQNALADLLKGAAIDENLRKQLLSQVQKSDSDSKNIFELSDISPEIMEGIFEYHSLITNKNVTINSLQTAAENIKKYNPLKSRIMKDNALLFEELGIEELCLVEDFPVVSAVFAWSRVNFSPEYLGFQDKKFKTTLNSFNNGSDKNGRTPVYIDNGKCEGLLIKISALKVVEWLRLNGYEVKIEAETDLDAKYFLAKSMRKLLPFEELDKFGVEYMVYTLVHTMAHIAMKAISGISGFEIQGLSEYLFPEELAFVIYSNKTDFIIGGMHTIFEEQAELYRDRMISRDLAICMHDPLCSEENNGACHACVFLPEISCSVFNKNLSRNVLFGTKGFWEDKIK